MTQRLRDTRYARELAAARLPTGPGGTSLAAIERIHVKQADQVEIRFSSWEGTRLLPRALDLPEEELLPLLEAAIREGVFSDGFIEGLRRAIGGSSLPAETTARAATDLERVQRHFHQLIRSRTAELPDPSPLTLPKLSLEKASEEEPAWLPIDGMDGGFKYWWDVSAPGLRLISESWSRSVPGSGQLHEITPAGAHLLGEGFA